MSYPVQKKISTAIQRATLRPYQSQAKTDISTAWSQGHTNVLAVLPTGAGKTVLFSDILHDHNGASCAIAHRQELVSQISLALARDRVRHKIIGPDKVVKFCVGLHMRELGASYYDPSAPCAVAGVDTLINRKAKLATWSRSVSLWVQDEAHHVLASNKWGDAASMFPNARGLGVTATPLRADGKGLGRHADGLFDTMVVGPSMRDLINSGYLTEYRIFAPPSDLDLSGVTIGASGEYVKTKLKSAVQKSHIIGDVVKHYLKIAPGKLGVTFASDVETATDIASQFNAAGVPAAVVSAKTPDADRVEILQRFRARELLQLVNVDLFGEGFDLPAIEVVSMARPTQSYGLYVQQFGRALRLMIESWLYPTWDQLSNEQRKAHILDSKKPRAIIIDHVGNVTRHGLPDAPRSWTLDGREKRSGGGADDAIPIKSCLNPECMSVYERTFPSCPYCGFTPEPTSRSSPEFVDGDLCELDPAKLAEMRGEAAKVDLSVADYSAELMRKRVPDIARQANVKRHLARQEAQTDLRESLAWWFGHRRAEGKTDPESYRLFYFKYGMDVLSAQALGVKDAATLNGKINEELNR